MTPPGYRLRLFLSVDLAGSTAFKAGPGGETVETTSEQGWVKVTRQFYHDFPREIQRVYRKLSNGDAAFEGRHPQRWKTVGDEILFCCRILNLHHLCICIHSFLVVLKDYGDLLKDDGGHLDVKGSGWVAAFPAPNVTVSLDHNKTTADQFPEEFEADADSNFSSVDFLGNGIDTGFRISSFCATNVFTMNVELAWLLVSAKCLNESPATAQQFQISRNFIFLGRKEMKGVIKNRPYPVIGIDVERNEDRRISRSLERKLLGSDITGHDDLKRQLFHFMRGEGIEVPFLCGVNDSLVNEPPESYKLHRQKWISDNEMLKKLGDLEASADTASIDGAADLPSVVITNAERVAPAAIEKSSSETDQ